jgi:hypothetical protein
VDVQGRSLSLGRFLLIVITRRSAARSGSATARSEREWMALWCAWCTFMIYLSTVLAHGTHTTHVMLLLTRPATSQGTQSHRKTCMLLNGYNEDQSQTTDTRRARRALSSP